LRTATTILFLMLIFCREGSGQQSEQFSINMSRVTFASFVEEVERQTGLHFYFDPTETDSLTVTVALNSKTAEEILQEVLSHSNPHYVIDGQNNVFITKGKKIAVTWERPDLECRYRKVLRCYPRHF
jgi:type II secretory pathway component GspD/PulD (secretin)